MKVLVAAAGTGGHINPAIAIANKIKKENPTAEITFVGTLRGLENDLVPRAGYPLKTIEVYGISREISIQNLKKIVKTLKGFRGAKKLIEELKPDIVIGTGGYVCGPIFLAATKKKIPTVLHESNAFPGVTVKMLSQKVDKILVGFQDAKARLPKAKKVVVTGNPTKFQKIELTEEKRRQLKQQEGFSPDKKLVLVFGGSQGARSINNALMDIIVEEKNESYEIIWAPGPKQYEIVKDEIQKKGKNINKLKGIKVVSYIYNMEETMNLADLVVCRSGAMTITELAIAGRPAIFVPLPTAAENHQEYNAKVLEKEGAARILLDKDLTGDSLDKMIKEMIQNQEKLKRMGENARKIAKQDVEEKIYQEIIERSS